MNKRLYTTKFFILLFLIAGCNDDLDNNISEVNTPIPIPDTSTIVYQTTEGQRGWHISLTNSNHTKQYQLSPGFLDITPVWSPDKMWIAFVRQIYPDTNFCIWEMRFNGENKIRLTPADMDCQVQDLHLMENILFLECLQRKDMIYILWMLRVKIGSRLQILSLYPFITLQPLQTLIGLQMEKKLYLIFIDLI